MALEYDDLRGQVRPVDIVCFVARESGHIALSSSAALPIQSVSYQPNWDAEAKLPEPDSSSTLCGAKRRQLIDSIQGHAFQREILVSRMIA